MHSSPLALDYIKFSLEIYRVDPHSLSFFVDFIMDGLEERSMFASCSEGGEIQSFSDLFSKSVTLYLVKWPIFCVRNTVTLYAFVLLVTDEHLVNEKHLQ